ncbi:MAG TPA: TIGR03557 family F420-dependent LLM class oxidoreductase [Actinomycetota bacterium]
MTEFGYKLCSEEHGPAELADLAAEAERVGFAFAMVSDHYHPWIDAQGESPFVWTTLGAAARATERLRFGTGVTCPTVRIHPAIVAQAAATVAALAPGRFFLGLGSGENLNEHVLGDAWPQAAVRQDMLEEAVEVIRELWSGEWTDHRGRFYTVERAKLYTLPEEPPEIAIAASGTNAAELAGRIGDAMIGLAPDEELMRAFDGAGGGAGKPRYAELTVCYAEDEAEARRIAHERWPNTAIAGELSAELPLPRHFEQAASMVTEDDVAQKIVCGPDPDRHLELIRTYERAGYDHLWFHQVGPDQQGFFRFYEEQVLPKAR